MKIDFYYFDDCPSHADALARLRQVMAEADIEAEIEIVRVATEEQAERFSFVGSPTIRVNGRDIDPAAGDRAHALTCRAYHLADGRISPLPSTEMIRRALQSEAGPS